MAHSLPEQYRCAGYTAGSFYTNGPTYSVLQKRTDKLDDTISLLPLSIATMRGALSSQEVCPGNQSRSCKLPIPDSEAAGRRRYSDLPFWRGQEGKGVVTYDPPCKAAGPVQSSVWHSWNRTAGCRSSLAFPQPASSKEAPKSALPAARVHLPDSRGEATHGRRVRLSGPSRSLLW